MRELDIRPESLGFRDVVKDGREALMVPCGNRDALADAMVALLDDETLRLRLGRTGRREAEQYAWSRVTERVLELYGSVLARRSVAA